MNVDIRVFEIGGSLLITAIFIAFFALVGEVIKPLSNIGYVVLLLAYTVVMCFFGLKLVPYLNE